MLSAFIIDFLRKQAEEKQKELEDRRPLLYIDEDDREPPPKEKDENDSNVTIIQM